MSFILYRTEPNLHELMRIVSVVYNSVNDSNSINPGNDFYLFIFFSIPNKPKMLYGVIFARYPWMVLLTVVITTTLENIVTLTHSRTDLEVKLLTARFPKGVCLLPQSFTLMDQPINTTKFKFRWNFLHADWLMKNRHRRK